MEVEVKVLEREYIYTLEGGKVRVHVKTSGKCVREIHIYDERYNKYKDYHLYDLDVPIETLSMLADVLEDLRYRII